jgi:hypothetical protein
MEELPLPRTRLRQYFGGIRSSIRCHNLLFQVVGFRALEVPTKCSGM